MHHILYIAAMAVLLLLPVANPAHAQQISLVGVVGALAQGYPLSCGAHYAPDLPGVFHPTAPCGSVVHLTNIVNNRRIAAQVISNTVPQRGARSADVSLELARWLGAEEDNANLPTGPQPLLVEMYFPQLEEQPAVEVRLPQGAFTAKEVNALASNMLYEASIKGPLGMVAVAASTANRASQCYRGCNLKQVVYAPSQFSWTELKKLPEMTQEEIRQATDLARRFQQGYLMAEEIAVTYWVGEAVEYYAHRLIPEPNRKHLNQVYIPQGVEDMLGHRFYRAKSVEVFGEPALVKDTRPTHYASAAQLYKGKLKGSNGKGKKTLVAKASRKGGKVALKGGKPKKGKASTYAQAKKPNKAGTLNIASK